MEKMYQTYKDIAEFFIVYISEAHASDSSWPVGYAKELGIKKHTNYGERCQVAQRLTKEKKLNIPCLIDGMDNEVEKSYHGHPDRVFLINKSGKLAVAARRGPWGFKPGLTTARNWLKEFKESGVEPDIVIDDSPDTFAMQRDMGDAFRAKDYPKALEILKKWHEADPDAVDVQYNLACVYSLTDEHEQALSWLGKAVDAGYSDAEHMLQDDDLAPLRDNSRFKELVSLTKANRIDPDDAKTVVGEWGMTTKMRGQTIDATMILSFGDGQLSGTWESMGRTMDLKRIRLAGNKLSFKRSMGEGRELSFEGTVSGDQLKGKYSSPMGELESNGTRAKTTKTSDAGSAGSKGASTD